jgi:carbamoyltransferase
LKILGTNYFGHNSSICLLDTREKTIFALSRERFTRIKHDEMFVDLIIKNFCPKFDVLGCANNGFIFEQNA